jgi:hypothetical protein
MNHVIMPVPDGGPRASKPALATPFPLLQDPAFQMPFQLFQDPSERARRPPRPATASILEGPSFVLPIPPVPSTQDPLVRHPLSPANSLPTLSQPTPPPRTDADLSDYAPRCDSMSGTHVGSIRFAELD